MGMYETGTYVSLSGHKLTRCYERVKAECALRGLKLGEVVAYIEQTHKVRVVTLLWEERETLGEHGDEPDPFTVPF